MGRLFWKFFLSYLAALLLAVFGVSAAAWLYVLAERNPDLSLEGGPRASFIVSSAASTLRHGGLEALRELMDDWGRVRTVRLFVTDSAGRDILGRQVPPDALARARVLADAEEEPSIVRRVRLPDGEAYLLFLPTATMPPLERFLFGVRPAPPIALFLTGALVSLAFGALLAWYVARPIRHLRSAFASLSTGRFETRVAPLIGGRRDEVADLGRDFDSMAQRLQALTSAQRSLLHDVSHELRSPLARLQAAIGLARQSPQKLEASLERIESEAGRVDELVGELLTLSRLEAGGAGGPVERSEQTDLVDLVAAIAKDAHFEAQASGRAVDFAGEGELVADVQVELLHRAVENVVRNAVQHTAPGTTVEVSARRNPSADEVVVTVVDRGPGVAESDLERIFEPFYRGAQSQTGRGFGLGLAIARRAVLAHRGRLCAFNRPGGGLVIEMALPLGDRDVREDSIATSRPRRVSRAP
jgi:two-component system OmpR family sensor kinase